MQLINFTEFRNHASDYLNKVESGNEYLIIRHGEPIAKLSPYKKPEYPLANQAPLMLEINEVSLSQEIIKERQSYLK